MPGCNSSPSPSSRPAASSSAGTTVSCSKCCGCVNDAVIQNVQSFGSTPITRGGGVVANGHSFDFVITMAFTGCAGAATSDCTLEWWEKTNVPAIAGASATTWTDMFALVPTSPTFSPWANRVVPCPAGGDLSVTIVDVPSLGNPPGVTQTRTLEFRLTVKSGGGCTCGSASKTARATQVLQMVNGSLVATGTSFTIL